jgi:hypothetical protein
LKSPTAIIVSRNIPKRGDGERGFPERELLTVDREIDEMLSARLLLRLVDEEREFVGGDAK